MRWNRPQVGGWKREGVRTEAESKADQQGHQLLRALSPEGRQRQALGDHGEECRISRNAYRNAWESNMETLTSYTGVRQRAGIGARRKGALTCVEPAQ